MKKVAVILGIIVSIVVADGHAQIAINDAYQLTRLIPDNSEFLPTNSDTVFEILDFYYQPDVENTKKEIYDAFDHPTDASQDPNPYIQFSGTVQSGANDFDTRFTASAGSVISGIGGLNVSTIADGAARFLIERSRQELTITFFNRFKEHLKEGTDLHVLFPQTADFLNQFASYEYGAMLNVIRNSFIQDLNNLPENIPKLSENYSAEFASTPGRLLLASLAFIKPITNGSDLSTILDIAANSEHLSQLASEDHALENIQPALQFLNVISQSLRSEREEQVWVNYNQINDLINQEITFRLYLGLIFQQVRNEEVQFKANSGNMIPLTSILATVESEVDNVEKLYRSVNRNFQSLNNTYSVLAAKSRAGDNLNPEEVFSYAADILDLTSSFGKVQTLLSMRDVRWPAENFEKWITIAERTNSMVTNLSRKNYSAAVVEVAILLKEEGVAVGLSEQLLTYGTFIASVAEAQKAEEVQAAIEAAALPAGSSRIKRQTKHNISINAFLGGFYGRETLVNIPDTIAAATANKTAGSVGLAAPIGLAVSWGGDKFSSSCDCRQTSYSSWTVFLSLIDIGSFVSYRAKGTTKDLPKFTLENILAPGVHIKYGIKNSPFAIGVGGQYGPQLREIAETNGNSVFTSSYRFQVSFSVDLPLFNIRTIPFD